MRPRRFVFTATDNIGTEILAGDTVTVDPDASPGAGQLVLVGNRLEPWDYQDGIQGVAVRVEREL